MGLTATGTGFRIEIMDEHTALVTDAAGAVCKVDRRLNTDEFEVTFMSSWLNDYKDNSDFENDHDIHDASFGDFMRAILSAAQQLGRVDLPSLDEDADFGDSHN